MQLITTCYNYDQSLTSYLNGVNGIILVNNNGDISLTPSLATLLLTKRDVDVKVMCQVNPFDCNYNYDPQSIETMFLDAQILLDNDADGICFGFLCENMDININLVKEMVDLIHSYQKVAIFNLAFDLVNDKNASLESLMRAGVDAVMYSGDSDELDLALANIKRIGDNPFNISIIPTLDVNPEMVSEVCEQLISSNLNLMSHHFDANLIQTINHTLLTKENNE